jgi:formylmethanofuran dehydrogenase subunit B
MIRRYFQVGQLSDNGDDDLLVIIIETRKSEPCNLPDAHAELRLAIEEECSEA